MQVIIDTNFILTCVKQKIDLFSQLKDLLPGAKIVVPKIVIEELNKLHSDRKLKMSEREAADMAVQIISRENILILDLGDNADNAIAKYASQNEKVIVASLDRGIKSRFKKGNGVKFLTIRARKRVAKE